MHTIDSNIESDTQIPRQVRERAERARQLMTPESDPPAASTDPQPTAEPVVTPPVAAPVSDLPIATDLLEPAPGKDNDPAYWRHRASAINGLWKKDKERFAVQIDQLKTQVATLTGELAKLQAAKPVADDIDLLTFFTAEQIEEIGEQQCKVLARAAMVAAQKSAQAQVESVVAPLRQKQEEDTANAHEQRYNDFLSELAKLVPTWQAINSDERWLNWLAQEDEASGLDRQDLLNRAQARYDAKRVAAMLNQFLDSLGSRAVVPPTPPVTPEGNAAGTVGNDPRPAVSSYPTKAEIKEFYKRAAIGKVTDEERKQFDARVAAAHAAGAL